MTHLHLGLASDPPVLITQLALLAALVLALADVAKVVWPRWAG
jgi:hypothetical protein